MVITFFVFSDFYLTYIVLIPNSFFLYTFLMFYVFSDFYLRYTVLIPTSLSLYTFLHSCVFAQEYFFRISIVLSMGCPLQNQSPHLHHNPPNAYIFSTGSFQCPGFWNGVSVLPSFLVTLIPSVARLLCGKWVTILAWIYCVSTSLSSSACFSYLHCQGHLSGQWYGEVLGVWEMQ